MTIEPNSFEFNLLFTLTIILLITKIILSIYLAWEVRKKFILTKKFSYDFLFSLFVLMLCLLISRLLWAYWDFYFTEFDPNRFYLSPGIFYWKIAALTMTLGLANFIFIIDRKVMDFKLKGILAYTMVIVAIIILFYPVNNSQDFEVVSSLLLLLNIVSIAIPVIFFYLGFKTPKFRMYFFSIAIGTILVAIGSNLVNEPILVPLRNMFGIEILVVVYLLFLILKISGYVLISYGVLKVI